MGFIISFTSVKNNSLPDLYFYFLSILYALFTLEFIKKYFTIFVTVFNKRKIY